MYLKRQCTKIVVGIFLSLLTALAYPISVEDTPQSVVKEEQDFINYDWLLKLLAYQIKIGLKYLPGMLLM